MKTFCLTLTLFLFTLTGAYAQPDTILLHRDMFASHQQIQLLPLDGWEFREGQDFNTAADQDWVKRSPLEISQRMADSQGRVDCRFRIAVRLDESLKDVPLFLSRGLWSATDVYINNRLLHSFGATGEPFRAFNPVHSDPVPLHLHPDSVYLLTIHLVDEEDALTARENRMWPQNLSTLLLVTGPEYNEWLSVRNQHCQFYGVLCIGVAFLLFFLFWLLVYLNPDQKVFKYIAAMATAVLLCAVTYFIPAFYELSYGAEKIRFLFNSSLFPIMTSLTLFVTEFVLRGRVSLLNKVLLPILAITSVMGHLYNISPPFGIANSIMLGYFAYLIFTYRKIITRTQTVVLASMLIPTLSGVVYVMLHKYWLDLYHEIEHPIIAIVILSSPVLLLVFISIRFREVLRDMAAEAEKVLKITEEKKSILENQNMMLENQVQERTREVMKQKEEADLQRIRSEELLLNILPGEVAEELMLTGGAQPKAYTMVTVMFTDFKDFTSVSEKVSAELLVEEIHYCFSMFDRILQNYPIEKIKTIGDAYLCAAGLPVSNYTHATDMVRAAMEIRDFMLKRKKEKEAKGEIPFVLRVGIHTGPVVAGVVGVKKYAYDIWGDTVNLAARMEQNCDPGKINISGSTYELVKDKFKFEYRGKIDAKNKGQIDMYFVD